MQWPLQKANIERTRVQREQRVEHKNNYADRTVARCQPQYRNPCQNQIARCCVRMHYSTKREQHAGILGEEGPVFKLSQDECITRGTHREDMTNRRFCLRRNPCPAVLSAVALAGRFVDIMKRSCGNVCVLPKLLRPRAALDIVKYCPSFSRAQLE